MNISELASLAGVSKAAVSRYFNDGYLSPEKREAISAAVAKTGYSPNLQAQTLRTRRTRQIGVILPKLSSGSAGRVMEGVAGALLGEQYLTLIANTANDPAKEVEYLDLFRRHQVEGVIMLATVFTPEHENILRSMRIPVVIVGQEYRGFDCVYHDDYGAALELTSLMLRHGAHRPAMIGVTLDDKAAGGERRRGFHDALEKNGLALRPKNLITAEFSIASGYQRASELFERFDGDPGERPDCLFCATDSIAVGAMKRCLELGLRIPEDVMLAGVGDSEFCGYCPVPLTSARLHHKTSGEEAAKCLLERLNGKNTGKRCLRLGYEIIGRESAPGN